TTKRSDVRLQRRDFGLDRVQVGPQRRHFAVQVGVGCLTSATLSCDTRLDLVANVSLRSARAKGRRRKGEKCDVADHGYSPHLQSLFPSCWGLSAVVTRRALIVTLDAIRTYQ